MFLIQNDRIHYGSQCYYVQRIFNNWDKFKMMNVVHICKTVLQRLKQKDPKFPVIWVHKVSPCK